METITQIDGVRIEIPYDALAELCRQYGVEELAVFGSALRDDYRPDSDLDFLVVFQNNDCGPWAVKLTDLETGLSHLFGRSVDLVSRRGVEQSANYIRRQHILQSARTIYVAR